MDTDKLAAELAEAKEITRELHGAMKDARKLLADVTAEAERLQKELVELVAREVKSDRDKLLQQLYDTLHVATDKQLEEMLARTEKSLNAEVASLAKHGQAVANKLEIMRASHQAKMDAAHKDILSTLDGPQQIKKRAGPPR